LVVSAGALMSRRGRQGERSDGELALGVLWALWSWRLELALLGLVIFAELGFAQATGNAFAAGGVCVVVGSVLLVAGPRRFLLERLYVARVRRAVGRAAFDAGLAAHPWSAPRVLTACRVAAGDRVRVRVRRGRSVAELEARAEQLAACLRAREVRVLRETANAAEGTVLVVRRDPFEEVSALRWPHAESETLSLWDPVPLGVDEQGEAVSVLLPERNVLMGGEPGAGKSAALSVLVAAATLDPGARLWLLDGKLVELAAWAPVARRVVGTSGREAIALLREVRAEMDARYRELLARGLRKVRREDELALHLVVCDELAFYLSLPDRASARSSRSSCVISWPVVGRPG
jgi:hypothetical protein